MRPRDVVIGLVVVSVCESLAVNLSRPSQSIASISALTWRLFLLNIALYASYSVFVYPFWVSPFRHLPYPKGGNVLLGQWLRVRQLSPPGEAFRRWMEEVPNDGLLRFWGLGGQDAIVVTSPGMLKTMLADNNYDYEKHPKTTGILRRLLGNGLILVEGDAHRYQRRNILPTFQKSNVRHLYPAFWEKSIEVMDMLRVETSRPEFEFGAWCTRVTLDIIGIGGFGHDFGSLQNPDDPFVTDYQDLFKPSRTTLLFFISSLLTSPDLVLSLPFEIPRKLRRVSQSLDDFSLSLVRARRLELERAPSVPRLDILSLLIRSGDLSDRDLSYQVLSFMAAGHDTTSNSLAWAAFLLARHPDVQTALREEIRSRLPPPPPSSSSSSSYSSPPAPDAPTLDSMPLLTAVVNETLRLYPNVTMFRRVAVRSTRLGAWPVPAGTEVYVSPWAVNRNTAIWGPDAADFRPGRWIDAATGRVNLLGGASHSYSMLTFSRGPRGCTGQGFARAMMQCLVAALVGRYEVEITRGEETYYPAGLVSMKAANGMWVRLREVGGW